MQYMNFELNRMLDLNENQIEEIRAIQQAYEIELSKVIREDPPKSADKIKILLRERNRRIVKVLNEQQTGILNNYCTDLAFFAKMLK